MIKKMLDFVFGRSKYGKHIDKVALEAMIDIAKKDQGNILILLSNHSYKDYAKSIDELEKYILENMQDIPFRQRLNRMDMSYGGSDSKLSISNTIRTVEQDFASVRAETQLFDRLFKTIFTRSRAELDEVAIKFLTMEGINVYII